MPTDTTRQPARRAGLPIASRALGVAMLLAAAASPARADQILQVYGDTLTSYKPSGATAANDVRPLHLQRGVNMDGSARAGSTFGWALAGNPFEGGAGGGRLGDVALATGTYAPMEIDLALPASVPWIIGRTHNHAQVLSSAHHDSNGPQGWNWFQSSQPELVRYEGSTDADDVVYIVYGADRYLEFRRFDATSDEYQGKNGAAGMVQYVSGSPDTYVYYDQHGTRTYFFGDNTSSDRADWQVWKIVDAAGNTAYVGDATTASTAATNGYNSDQTISKAYDSAGRRFCYSYTTYGVSRLTQVLVETDAGGGWGNCGAETEVGKVEYAYYTADGDDHGKAGDLKQVTVTIPQTDSGISVVKKTYYRYYDAAWSNSDGLRGEPHMIKMAVHAEGVRAYDWSVDSLIDDDHTGATDSALKPYSEAYLEYVSSSDYRVKKVYYNGECGCSGGNNGTYEMIAYGTGSNYSTAVGNTSYDNGANDWARTVVKQPDNIYFTQYFDETGQATSRVVTDADPSGSPTDMWATQVVRDSSGRVTELRTPAANDTYTHSSGAFTSFTGAGLITIISRVSSGDMAGFAEFRTHKKGTSGTEYYDAKSEYTSATKTVGDIIITRPFVSAQRSYHVLDVAAAAKDTASNYRVTSMAYTAWTGDAALMPKSIVTTHPAVTTANNGSNSSNTATRYLRKDGTSAFTLAEDGIYTYTAFTNGQLTTREDDVITNGSFTSGDDPNTDWGITESASGSNRTTSITYDAQGRPDQTTLPDGRLTKNYYSRLKDHQMVVIAWPRITTGGSTTYYGPASYSITNQAGKGTGSGTIAITSSGLTDALSTWIDETDGDPITALDKGTLARWSTGVTNSAGTRVETSRVYFDIPASGTGTEGTHYDATRFGFDDMGRQRRVKDATGTITRSTFDDLGRTTERHIGTNDNGLAGGESSGTANMVKTEAIAYDSGADGGNSHVTTRTAYVVDGTTDQRVTTYTYDYRGRLFVTVGPQAPYALNKYDNLGRTVAVGLYSSSSGLDETDDPTSLATNRMALSQTFFDEMGRVYKSQRHKIDDADGSDDDNLQSLTWYDAAGRVVKSEGETLAKTIYDRLGRAERRFTLSSDNDSVYADADDVTGDIVITEDQTVYESTDSDNVLMSVHIARLHDDLSDGTTGVLDLNDEVPADLLALTADDVKGRVQITAMWYDVWDRVTDTVAYGTNAIVGDRSTATGTFDRDGLAVPSRSDTALRTSYTFNDDGSLKEVTDPRALVTRTEYDDAGRQTAVIRNYVNGTPSGDNGDDDNYTRFEYTNGLQTKMWVDWDGDNVKDASDQVTTYIYGSTKDTPSAMKIATGHLLRAVKYPDTTNSGTTVANIDSDSSDVVSHAYNAQGELTYTKDQAGTVHDFNLDTGGRRTHDRATTLGSGIDTAVRRITWAYDSLSRVSTVTTYDNATVGSGSAVNEVKYTYDDWGNAEKMEQDRDGAVAGGGNDYEVSWTYAKATGGRNTIRRATMTLPSTASLTYTYLSTGNSLDENLSRVTRVSHGATIVAAYKYLGDGMVVNTDLAEPNVSSIMHTTTTGDYARLDRFNRVVDSRWTAQNPNPDKVFYEVDLTYDRNSNILEAEDQVQVGFDAKYAVDNLDRLTDADEGTLSSGSITSRTRREQWTLSQTGNWADRLLDLNGDSDYLDTGGDENLYSVTYNAANEQTARTIDWGDGDATPTQTAYNSIAFDGAGNLTDDQWQYEYVYDAWNRLRLVKSQSSVTVAEYLYNGLGHRIGWHYNADGDGSLENPPDDPWYYFAYDDRWVLTATYRGSDTSPKEEFTRHNAGLDGTGGSSYIDLVVLRERDNTNGWTGAADGVLEQRRYFAQNWRADVSAVLTDTGKMAEWVKYSAYGIPFGLPSGDSNSDGDWDSSDSTEITDGDAYDVRQDADLDGDNDAGDVTHANSITTTYQTLGRANPTSTGVMSRRGYAGYEYDPALLGTASETRTFWHVKHRVLDSALGRWVQRDPAGYVDRAGLYAYAALSPVVGVDPMGLDLTIGLPCMSCNPHPGTDPPHFECPPGFRYDPLLNQCVIDDDPSSCADNVANEPDPALKCWQCCSNTPNMNTQWIIACKTTCVERYGFPNPGQPQPNINPEPVVPEIIIPLPTRRSNCHGACWLAASRWTGDRQGRCQDCGSFSENFECVRQANSLRWHCIEACANDPHFNAESWYREHMELWWRLNCTGSH